MSRNMRACIVAFTLLYGLSTTQSFANEGERPLPSNTAPGIVEVEQVDGKFVFSSRELSGLDSFQILQDLPLAQIKGDRSTGETIKFGCYPAPAQTACLVEAKLDDDREIWFYRDGVESGSPTLAQLPDQVVDSLFWNSPLMSLVGNGPLTFTTTPEGLEIPAKAWMENRGGGPTFHTYDLPTKNQLLMTRPSFNGKELSGLFLVLNPIYERYVTPSEGFEILAASSDGNFTKYAVPPKCEVLGAINDVVICGANPRGNSSSSLAKPYPKVMRLKLPFGVEEDITRNNQAPAFQAIGDSILIRGMANGIARPFIQTLGGDAVAALSGEETCILPYEHVDIFDITASQSAALMRVISPIRPNRLILAPIKEERIQICAPSAQLYRQGPIEDVDHSQFQVERAFIGTSSKVPFTLVSGNDQGLLQGNLLVITYPHAAIWLPEGYLGPWLKNWINEGGKIAIVHLPGGGGYGAQWSSEGYGIRNKIKVSHLFDEVTQKFVEKGLADNGKIAVLTESGGGPVMAHAILRNPDRYSVLALRAACLAIEGEQREACAAAYDYGNWFDRQDRALMEQFEPLNRILSDPKFPAIVYGRPEFDSVLKLPYQNRMIERLKPKNPIVVPIPGVNHAARTNPSAEVNWVQAIAQAAIKSQSSER